MNVENSISDLFDKFWNWRLENNPEFATFCGFHEHDDKLEIYTSSAILERQKNAERFIEEAKKLTSNADVNTTNKENNMFLTSELEVYAKGLKAKGYYFPLSYLDGPHLEFERLISSMKFETIDDYRKLLSRYSALPTQISQMTEMMRAGMGEELTYHMVSVASIPDQIDHLDVSEKKIEESCFYKPFLALPDSILDDEKKSLLNEAANSISSNVIPAFKSLKHFLQMEYFKKVRLEPGISSVPGGNEFYQLCIEFHLGYRLTPKEIHEMGLLEVSRISGEIENVIKSLGFEKMSLIDFAEQLRKDKRFYFEKPEELLESYKDLVFNKINPKLKTLFKNIPESEVIIEPFPPAMNEGPMAYYLAGTADGKRPGVFYVNIGDVKTSPKYEMTALALHEAMPGHHFQQAFLFSIEDLPTFRKYVEDRKYSEVPSRFPLHSAYVEGWGLYSEYLGTELGLYEDKYDYFGYLSTEIFRAARLVVDTGIHAFNWSQEQAVSYMMVNTATSKREIVNEVKRYITWPGQACAYKIGEMKIKSLRKMAEKTLGSKFNIQNFHEVVLKSFGPLDVLEKEVIEFIKSNE